MMCRMIAPDPWLLRYHLGNGAEVVPIRPAQAGWGQRPLGWSPSGSTWHHRPYQPDQRPQDEGRTNSRKEQSNFRHVWNPNFCWPSWGSWKEGNGLRPFQRDQPDATA